MTNHNPIGLTTNRIEFTTTSADLIDLEPGDLFVIRSSLLKRFWCWLTGAYLPTGTWRLTKITPHAEAGRFHMAAHQPGEGDAQ